MLTFPVSHWAWSMEAGEEPRCMGTIRPYHRDELWIYAECDGCQFEVGVSCRHRERAAPAGYDPDSRTQSQREDAPC